MQQITAAKFLPKRTLLRQGVCVSHLHRCTVKLFFSVFVKAGGSGPLMNPLPTKLFMSWEDIQTDHLDVPALVFFGIARG